MALLLAQARNVPQAHAALTAGPLGALALGGRRAGRQDARHRRARPHRQARRPAGHWPSACGSSPTTRSSRPSGPGRWASSCSTLDQPGRRGRLPHHPPAEDARDRRAHRRASCWPRPSRAADHQRGPRRHRRRGGPGRRHPRRVSRRRRPRRVRHRADHRVAAVRARLRSSSRPHLGASTREAQDKAGDTIAEMVQLALAGEFVPFAVNVNAAEANETVRPVPAAGRAPRAAVRARWPAACPTRSRSRTEGEIAELRHPHPHPVGAEGLLRRHQRRAGHLRERAAAGQGARRRGPRDVHAPRSADYVNLSPCAAAATSLAGTLVGPARRAPHRAWSTTTPSTCRRPTTCWSSATTTAPGVIGIVGTLLGDAGVNIADMDVGRGAEPGSALMVLATTEPDAGRRGRGELAAAARHLSVHVLAGGLTALLLDGDGAGRAAARRPARPCPRAPRRLLLEDVEVAVAADLEHLGHTCMHAPVLAHTSSRHYSQPSTVGYDAAARSSCSASADPVDVRATALESVTVVMAPS